MEARDFAAAVNDHLAGCGVAEAVQDEEHGPICPGCGALLTDLNVPEPRGDEPDKVLGDYAAAAAREGTYGGAPYREAVPGQTTQDVQLPEPDEAQQGSAVARRPVYEVAVPVGQDPITRGMSTVDPTRIYSPDDIASYIADCNARLDRGLEFHRRCIEQKYAADVAYTMAYARAIDASEGGSADVRRAQATLKCELELNAKELATLKLKALEATTHDLRAMLSGFQTMLKAVQSTYDSAGQAAHARPHGRAF